MLPLRLRRVSGHEGRENDILFHPPRSKPPTPETLVFFGGDVQDYEEVMQAHRDNRNYVRWSLENTARLLSEHFPTKHIVVVRPARIEYKSFSCYDNFVPSSNAGVPEHTPTHSALHHLEKLLQEVGSRIKAMPVRQLCEAVVSLFSDDVEQSCSRKDGDSNGATKCDAVKGESDDDDAQFIERIQSMWWLDGGHAGGKNTWITARSLLETLARLDVNVYVHVSPYQVNDEGRPWIGREEKTFSSLLHRLGAKIERYVHAEGSTRYSLNTHFNVLANFKQVQDSRSPDPHNASDDDN
ncbi:mitochondrial protein C2orf69 homolog isoform X3 [Pieris brassicae]|uniref:mitochondrial protein C2orf69 homolog isoform X3 n=1 Tax=Pieris brassicae TaxID=7116 RepID=UPI001E65F1FA|nr:mitochondrial protein C2orf69 homolog isoform X3 [Pieris brassicae]